MQTTKSAIRRVLSRRIGLWGVLAGWMLVLLVWAMTLSIAFQRLNLLPYSEVPGLLLFWAVIYAAIGLPAWIAANALLILKTPPIPFLPGALIGGSFEAVLLIFLNLLSRWSPAYKAVSPVRAHLVPMGAFDLGALSIGCCGLLVGAVMVAYPSHAPRRRYSARTAAVCVVSSMLVLAGSHLANVVYERPSRVDLEARVAPFVKRSAACDPASGTPPRLVVLALDGMTWNVAAPLLEQGRMPNLQELLGRSVYGHLDTFLPSYSPVVWATVATGLTESDHRVHGFLRFRIPGVHSPISRGPRLNSFIWWGASNRLLSAAASLGIAQSEPLPSAQRKGATLWDVAGANDFSVGVYNWMNTWPVAPVNGYIYTRTGPRPSNAYPSAPVLSALATSSPESEDSAIPPGLAYAVRDFRQAWTLFRSFRPEVSFQYNKIMDNAHDHWTPPDRYFLRVSGPPYASFRPLIENAYTITDDWIGRFSRALTPRDVLVIVSDHGYEFNGTHHAFAPPGVVVLSGGPFACNQIVEDARIFDIAPTLLSLLHLPGLESMPGHVLDTAFARTAPAPKLERLARYPDQWRSFPEPAGKQGDENWDQLMRELRAMGYVN